MDAGEVPIPNTNTEYDKGSSKNVFKNKKVTTYVEWSLTVLTKKIYNKTCSS